MRLILLSGGSGKRLWPLSNEARSKQFLPLLQGPDGNRESMVQRVLRQASEAGLGNDIVLATNASQKDIIQNQLGENIETVLEPERRDTFPAIALAVSYLAKEKGCGREEVVVVMPCDPYTEAGYFNTVARMVKAVENDAASLVLMGITPDCPSEKFGYVVPRKGAEAVCGALPVERFTENPDTAKAELLLKEGALWNGGVFAFRLGYVLDIAEKYVKEDTFGAVRAKYSVFPKISFDYEVAEKADSVAVVPFTGQWKDLGTWNALCQELPSNEIGNSHLGPQNDNTHIVNELSLPIFCDGLKDIVVAASPDGILVCSKDRSEFIKKHVDSLESRPMYEERRWGTYRVIDDTTYSDGYKSLTKSITLKAGKNISYQIHRHRSEVWTFVDGEGKVMIDDNEIPVCRGSLVHIRQGQKHAVKATTDLTFIEVQSGDLLTEEDIIRLKMEWPGN
jgi:mannose-1-phosphate guanylyltransferase